VLAGIGDAAPIGMTSLGRSAFAALATFVVIGSAAAPSVKKAEAQEAEPCDVLEIEYATAGRLRLADTPMGAGDGLFDIGPGALTIRVANEGGKPGGAVTMRAYSMHEHFTVNAHAALWTTHVTTDTHTAVTPDACGDVAHGEMENGAIRWSTPLSGYRADGTLTCDGSMCGKFGAPPPGKSDFHSPHRVVTFQPFKISADGKTFTMSQVLVSHSESPKQTAYLALSGRETRRTCVQSTPQCR
jgi:hypothetical protein